MKSGMHGFERMRKVCSSVAVATLGLLCLSSGLQAQPVIGRIFPASEFAARRAAVMKSIGDGVAIIQGTTERPGEQPLRQNNEFYYLTGVIEPRAILMIDGRTKRSTLFLSPTNEKRELSMFGPSLIPGDSAEKDTGIESVVERDKFGPALIAAGTAGRQIFTPFRAEVLGSASAADPVALARATKADPWDGRDSREEAFQQKMKAAAPAIEIRNLDPIIDTLRAIKSPREIEIIREATNIAGLGIMEAMRDAKPGMHEYELQADAEFVFKKHGSYGPAYFALIATGKNTYYTHYHKDTAILQDGDLVQFDYAPDYNYYTSDVTRIFPANGKFTARQKEMYNIYLRLYQALMTSIKPYVSANDIAQEAVGKMEKIVANYKFSDSKIKDAANSFIDLYRGKTVRALGHTVGMSVHDTPYAGATLQPGEIFTIEPEMRIPDEHLGFRLEDMLLITKTGYVNMSGFVPVEVADIEKLMAQRGLSDAALKLPAAK
ncbi:MAG TPA: Xaa-Pro peptidase family protein [Gemmatimonadaceae bacterium]|nr:Xaa-Pro peptidase family protein [Gemmatimonadaceae bacterium]